MRYVGRYQFIPLLFIVASAISQATTKTATISISATLEPTCQAGTGSSGTTSFGTLDFGSQIFLNQSVFASGTAVSRGAISVMCNAGVTYHVMLGTGGNSSTTNNRYMVKSGTGEQIRYNLFVDAAHNTIWDNQTGVSKTSTGVQDTLPVYGLVYAQSTPSSGVYNDTVIVTVSW